jgi:hypothetical protein
MLSNVRINITHMADIGDAERKAVCDLGRQSARALPHGLCSHIVVGKLFLRCKCVCEGNGHHGFVHVRVHNMYEHQTEYACSMYGCSTCARVCVCVHGCTTFQLCAQEKL